MMKVARGILDHFRNCGSISRYYSALESGHYIHVSGHYIHVKMTKPEHPQCTFIQGIQFILQ